MSDGRDNVTDRVASRFETETDDDQQSQSSQKDQNAGNDQSVQNVKKAWNAKSVYLPDHLENDLRKGYKRLDLELDDELSEFRKTRHFYPLVIAMGLDALQELDSDEVMEELERIESTER